MPVVTVIPATKEIAKHEKKPVRKVAAYARVSTLHAEQEESFEAQQMHFKALVDATPGWELTNIYADHGISGLSMKVIK